MDTPSLPSPLRRTATNLTSVRAEAVLTRWSRQFRALEEDTGLSVERIELLAALEKAGAGQKLSQLTGSELAEALGVSRPAITRMVVILEEAGLVKKLDNALDGRSVVVRLTPAGRRVVNKARANRVRAMASRLRGRSERELAQLAQGLRILEEMLED
ncbi:MAG: MarR family winged helix-turn-helix transcriptional regulator [Acidimicrobiia bacterium]